MLRFFKINLTHEQLKLLIWSNAYSTARIVMDINKEVSMAMADNVLKAVEEKEFDMKLSLEKEDGQTKKD